MYLFIQKGVLLFTKMCYDLNMLTEYNRPYMRSTQGRGRRIDSTTKISVCLNMNIKSHKSCLLIMILFLIKPPYLDFYKHSNFSKKTPYSLLVGQIFNLIYNTV